MFFFYYSERDRDRDRKRRRSRSRDKDRKRDKRDRDRDRKDRGDRVDYIKTDEDGELIRIKEEPVDGKNLFKNYNFNMQINYNFDKLIKIICCN